MGEYHTYKQQIEERRDQTVNLTQFIPLDLAMEMLQYIFKLEKEWANRVGELPVFSGDKYVKKPEICDCE